MKHCPSCGAHHEDDADYCPVCGESFPGPHLSEATGPVWHDSIQNLVALALLLWPVALYGLYKRDKWDQNIDQWILVACLAMAGVWSLLSSLL